MGLKNQIEYEQQESDSDTTTTAEKPTTPPARTASTAVGQVKKFSKAFAEFENVLDTMTVESLSLAAPRIKGEQGSMFLGNKDLGDTIHFELVSYNARWVIGSGENDKEAKDYFRVSYDNKTLTTGEDVADYLESLKAQGFKKAKKSPYLDVWGFVTWSAKNGTIDVESRQLACLQCSQTSLGAFMAFATTRGLLMKAGLVEELSVIEVKALKQVNGTNKYTNFGFAAPKI
mgnify:FL=1